MSKRKSISKGKRFDIFKRDGFTCQYCGQQPPAVVLHIDHIVPVIEGGTNDEMNLVTSCRDCNLGKGKKLLDKPQRPDADLAWIETQQELAELRQYQEAQKERRRIVGEIVDSLQDVWIDYSGLDWAPSGSVIRNCLTKHDPETIETAFISVAPKVAGGYIRDGEWLKYLWGTLKTMEAEK